MLSGGDDEIVHEYRKQTATPAVAEQDKLVAEAMSGLVAKP